MPQRLRVQYSVEKLVRRMVRARGVRYVGAKPSVYRDAVVFNGMRRARGLLAVVDPSARVPFRLEVTALVMVRYPYNWRAMKRILRPRIEEAINGGP